MSVPPEAGSLQSKKFAHDLRTYRVASAQAIFSMRRYTGYAARAR